jgi:hypothetical protein
MWSAFELVIVSETPMVIEKRMKTIENKTCYNTLYSNDILQHETSTLTEDNVNYAIRFIADTDVMIANRYSILVKQYVQSFNAYNYYNTLNKLSSSENVFNINQPGFIAGNISCETEKDEKVIGFFEVSSISEKRMFFNFRDIFTTPFPTDVSSCELISPPLIVQGGGTPLLNVMKNNKYIYFEDDITPGTEETPRGPYLLVTKACGDCTELGSNIKPSFWID